MVRVLKYEQAMIDTVAYMSKRYKSLNKWVIKHSELSYMGETEKAFINIMIDKGHFILSSDRKTIQPNPKVASLFDYIQSRYSDGLDVSLTLSEPLLEICNILEDFNKEDKLEFIRQKYVGKYLLDVPININTRAKVIGIEVKEGKEYLELEIQPIKKVDNILVSIDDIARG